MRLRRFIAALVWAGVMGAAPVSAVRIGLFADPAGTSCSVQVPINTLGTLYVVAILDDPPANGIAAAEFRITGMPSGWFPSFNLSGAVYSIRSPLQGGTVLGFQSCRLGSNRIVPLGTLSFFATSSVSNVILRVEASSTPTNAAYPCPLVALCDVGNECVPGTPLPKNSKLCAEGLQAYINGGSCTVDAGDLEPTRRLSVYPNPAPGRTAVHFAAPRGGPARLVIYDLAGRRVRALLDAGVDPGARSIVWDGRDDAGRSVASGVYFVELTAPGV